MNILSDLTRHLIMASSNLKIRPKSALVLSGPSIELSEGKTPQISLPMPSHEAFMPHLYMQKQELKPVPLESLASSFSQPISVPEPSFSLGSIGGFAGDNSISMIVCDGPMKPIKVKKGGRLEQTSVILSRSEIDSIINAFSKKSNLPLKPVFRARIDNLSILALVSSIESRFMITMNH